jgi:hypothetical protein
MRVPGPSLRAERGRGDAAHRPYSGPRNDVRKNLRPGSLMRLSVRFVVTPRATAQIVAGGSTTSVSIHPRCQTYPCSRPGHAGPDPNLEKSCSCDFQTSPYTVYMLLAARIAQRKPVSPRTVPPLRTHSEFAYRWRKNIVEASKIGSGCNRCKAKWLAFQAGVQDQPSWAAPLTTGTLRFLWLLLQRDPARPTYGRVGVRSWLD